MALKIGIHPSPIHHVHVTKENYDEAVEGIGNSQPKNKGACMINGREVGKACFQYNIHTLTHTNMTNIHMMCIYIIYIYMYIYIYARAYLYVYIYIYMHVHICMCIYIYTTTIHVL